MKQRSDEQLIGLFCTSGNMEVLGELYERYMHLVYGVCLKYLRNRDDSKDAVIHIFEKLIREIPKQKIENFRSWLHVVTKNYCLMQLRAQKSLNEKQAEWINDPSVFMENDNVLHPLDTEEPNNAKDLEDCISRLNEEQKRSITSFYFENKCYREIASEMGLDEKKVKSHLQNGKRNLKLCLEKKNEEREQA